jgi:hypothetical protein
MANKKISELDIRTSLSLSDLLAVGDPTTGYLYKITITDLKTLTGAGVISFNGRIGSVSPAEGDYNLTQLGDVIITSASNNQILQYNGSNWVNATINLSGYVPYTGASANVDLGTFDLTTDIVTLNQVKAVGSGGISFNSNNGTQIAAMGGGGGAGTTFYGGIIGTTASFTSSGSSNTFDITHSSGSGIALNITKGGNGEGLYINKTSGSGNAATIIGTLNASTLVKTGGTSSQFLKADGSVDSSTYLTTSSAASTYVPLSRTLTINGTSYDLSADRSWTINSMVYPGAGIAVSTGTAWGTSITDNSANWDAAYTARITSATSPLNITSNVISITQASTSTNGFLTGTDWNTFANKIGGSGASGYVSFFNGAASITGSTNLFWDAANNRLGVGTSSPSAGITSFSSTAATQFKAAGTAPAFTFSETLTSPIYGAVFGLATSSGQFVTGTIAGDMAIANQSQSAGAIVFGTGTTEGMRLTSAGTLSIGNTNTTYKLDVTGIGRFTTSLFVSSAGADTVSSGANIQFSSNVVIQTNTALGLDFWMNNSGTWNRKVTFTNDGKLGIGNTAPTYTLDCTGTARFTDALTIGSGNALKLNRGANDYYWSINNDSSNNLNFGTYLANGTAYGTNPKMKLFDNGTATFSSSVTTTSLVINSGASNNYINFVQNSTNIGYVGDANWIFGGSISDFGMRATNNLVFGIGATKRMNISSANSGTIVFGSADSAANSINFYGNYSNNQPGYAIYGSAANLILEFNGNTKALYLGSLGTGLVYSNAGILTSTNPSDERLKENIVKINYGLKDILKLRPVKYNWKNDKINQGIQFGFIAQEVKEIMPDSIKEFGEDVKYLGLEKDAIYATLVNAIQEQQAQIEELKAKLK